MVSCSSWGAERQRRGFCGGRLQLWLLFLGLALALWVIQGKCPLCGPQFPPSWPSLTSACSPGSFSALTSYDSWKGQGAKLFWWSSKESRKSQKSTLANLAHWGSPKPASEMISVLLIHSQYPAIDHLSFFLDLEGRSCYLILCNRVVLNNCGHVVSLF